MTMMMMIALYYLHNLHKVKVKVDKPRVEFAANARVLQSSRP